MLCVIKEYLRLSSFESTHIYCESGALSTEPLPRGIFTSCCAQYLCLPNSALQIAFCIHQICVVCLLCIALAGGGASRIQGQACTMTRARWRPSVASAPGKYCQHFSFAECLICIMRIKQCTVLYYNNYGTLSNGTYK